MTSKHEFALFVDQLSENVAKIQINQEFKLANQDLAHRISNVLRLKAGEQVALFDRASNCLIQLNALNKKEIQGLLLTKQYNKKLTPSITFALPLLKRDDFEVALYSLVELGANKVQIITTQKTQRAWGQEKEFERCQRVLISAAEQSKNFAMPELCPPITLTSFLSQIASNMYSKVYFDVDGQPCMNVIESIVAQKSQELILMAGPEGDLTADEKQIVQNAGFQFCALTPTILRAASAVQLGLGIFRTVVK